MKPSVKTSLPIVAILLLSACGSSPEGGDTASRLPPGDAPSLSAPVASEAPPKRVTRAQAEQAYRCRGLLSAAWASQKMIPADQLPDEVKGLTMAEVNYWTKELGSIAPGVLTAQEEAELMSSTTRVLATAQALDKERTGIKACREAAGR